MRARWILAVVLNLLAAPAWGQGSRGDNVAEARGAEARARHAFDKGDFEAAARSFAEAFRLAPQAATKYNEGFAWSRAGRPAAAADAYEAALELGGLAPELEQASTERLAHLKRTLGRLVVSAPVGATVSVAHAEERPIPTRIHLEPGKHDVSVRYADGSLRREVIVIEAGISKEVSFPENAPAALRVPRAPSPAPAPAPPPATPPEPVSGTAIAGWTLFGVGGAALIAMAATGGLTLATIDDYNDGGNLDPELRDRASTLRTTTNALLGVGAGLAAAGLVLVIVDAAGDDAPDSAALVLGAPGASLQIAW